MENTNTINDTTNKNERKVVNSQYLITRKVINVEYHYVDTNDNFGKPLSKAAAMRAVRDDETVAYETHYLGQNYPKFESMLHTYECPNKGTGYTDVASDIEAGTFAWHYNGMCNGTYQDKDTGICYVCAGATPAKGYRKLTHEELQYIKEHFGVDIE